MFSVCLSFHTGVTSGQHLGVLPPPPRQDRVPPQDKTEVHPLETEGFSTPRAVRQLQLRKRTFFLFIKLIKKKRKKENYLEARFGCLSQQFSQVDGASIRVDVEEFLTHWILIHQVILQHVALFNKRCSRSRNNLDFQPRFWVKLALLIRQIQLINEAVDFFSRQQFSRMK